ncbi:hypothetical protein ACPCTO_08450 [Streptomyces olivoreticuli]
MVKHTEQHTGRLWTVRITSDWYPRPGPMTLRCSEPGCRPGRIPLPSPTAARTAAAGHLASHGHAAGPVPPATECRCGEENCSWHAWSIPGCQGRAVHQVITHTCAGRVWNLAEMCAHCAKAIPDARVLRLPNGRADTPPAAENTGPEALPGVLVRSRPPLPTVRLTLGGTPAEYLLDDPESSLATPPPGARYDGRVHAAWVLGREGFSAEWLARTLDMPYEDAARIHGRAHPARPQ